MAYPTFKKGDVVQFASGGPRMTVCYDGTTPGYVWCEWFDGSVKQGDEFDPATLVKAPAPQAPMIATGKSHRQ